MTAAATVGLGDAENDQAFMHLCGVAVAVRQRVARPEKGGTFRDLDSINGAGVRDVIDRILAGTLNTGPHVIPSWRGEQR